ncbi:MAG: ABC transporter ATP-binding protein [Flavobacteriaceae bacterium]|jgi:ABC-2 type transport system ATP-binding protein|nr:ABC transporter ATP-binding protein [Flavobacteriaceae bacterium]MDP4674198.1 ABC transporter ATP-binding protein [Flavobacteriaceae bacterium]MDP4755288.1 ABC transporter ATP-binding protein [Flavobacteriaceae bacterium]MDP4795211.1 ABC transporter ATP-binding protein [Flavobacteriaceae bacterium]MDP4886236.1 ABC transporter ATP-binding protein [Flavobacteriaceae bacterium]
MIHIEQLSKSYSGTTVLDIETLQIPSGTALGLVGNNGAGKTTLFSCLLDLIKPTQGHITNRDLRVDQSEAWKDFTSAFIDESFLIGYLTPEEYFSLIASLRTVPQSEVDTLMEELAPFFNGEVLGQKKYLRDFSKGNQKKVGIAATLIGKPSVVVLDEPFANLDPTTQFRLKDLLKKIASQGDTTLLVSSHDLNHVTEVCKRIVVLSKGKVIQDLETNPSTLAALETYFAQQVPDASIG